MSSNEDFTIIHMKEALAEIEAGEIKKYIFGWETADGARKIVITSHDLKGLKSTIRSAITEPRQ